MYGDTLANDFIFLLAWSQRLETLLLKVSLLSIMIPEGF